MAKKSTTKKTSAQKSKVTKKAIAKKPRVNENKVDIWLVRHGVTVDNVAKRCQGQI